MARIAGVTLPNNKRVEIALTYIHGIGLTRSQQILKQVKIDQSTRVEDLSDAQITQISGVIDENYQVEGELRQIVARNIRRLKEIRCYRGIRHRMGLPVRGQQTRTNAVTRKGRSIAVGGLNPKITKK
ncbi:30S ribosomal protein S13 [Candidatus Dojkabacteria bacterium]|uniref:Small ribosomal subunit protein uS13 n=1 Tax=Candidatus Dojkabacteria bacterium TaxID=2099670 RepID=A0A955L8R9_9BACT|nr:30S ribosomal protein S13 [Candidatus Dojkabacteria bacterium]